MKNNVEELNTLKLGLNLAVLKPHLSLNIIDDYRQAHKGEFRDRLYSLETTYQGMIMQSLLEDKSEQNAVILLNEHFKKQKDTINQLIEKAKESQDQSDLPKNRGRPRKHFVKVQESKMKEVSLNTASYNEARQRFPLELLETIFKTQTEQQQENYLWHGHRVFIADGTTLKTIDNPELRSYLHPKKDSNPQPLPTMKIEGLIEMYGGLVVGFEMDHYNSSEGQMIKRLYPKMPKGSILMADDLYSGYGHFAFCNTKGINLISQGKHKRGEKSIKRIGPNDEYVEWSSARIPSWFTDEDELPPKMLVRKISFTDPGNPKKISYLYTNLMDTDKYSASDILVLYFSRWDIELGFREIKIIMSMEYLRSKSVNMVKKEVYIYFILYNIIKSLMLKTTVNSQVDFFSLGKKVQISTTIHKNDGSYIDKLGRSYSRSSTGRYGKVLNQDSKKTAYKKERTEIN